jgi:hypothetical protein
MTGGARRREPWPYRSFRARIRAALRAIICSDEEQVDGAALRAIKTAADTKVDAVRASVPGGSQRDLSKPVSFASQRKLPNHFAGDHLVVDLISLVASVAD